MDALKNPRYVLNQLNQPVVIQKLQLRLDWNSLNSLSFGVFYKNVGRFWRMSDCEELVGVTYRGWCEWLTFLVFVLNGQFCDPVQITRVGTDHSENETV